MDPVCAAPADDDVDALADETIARCVTASPPVSFFLSAGAGSGKTRSLVRALDVIRSEVAAQYRLRGQHVGVITFTNKACDEIRRRLAYDPLFSVSTIHSFAWSLIGRHNTDIRERLKADLRTELVELGEKERTGRTGSRASLDRQAAIAALGKRVEILDEVRSFIYSPDGDNLERNALSHAEVIRISSVLVSEKPLMQELLVTRFPILLIDESQDTDKLLLDTLLRTQYECPNRFCLGVIGDAMQRIYLAGRLDIADHISRDWAKPVKLLNHRSGRRIVELVNRIRAPIDGQEQRSRRDRGEGVVRLFVLPAGIPDKSRREDSICHRMAEVTADEAWRSPRENVKTLVLEHHMAASRLDFLPMWQALDRVEALKTGLRDGSLPAIGFYSELILPLVKANRRDDKFAVASLVRKRSPLLDRHRVEACGTEQVAQLALARQAVDDLCQLWSDNDNPSFLDVLRRAVESGLFGAPEALRPF
ncbi:MAG: ATP-dependent helicase, partial [Armatimonadetes bacterium]|nr:ATP-dependent helicase [Armatimonadota bacterium]